MLLAFFAVPLGMRGQASVGTTMWAEDFSYYVANNVPTGTIPATHTGTTIYNDGSVTYSVTNGGTTSQIYEAALAGGTSPELLISKGGGTFTIADIPTGDATELTLTYKTNNNNNGVTSPTTGVTVTEVTSKASLTRTFSIEPNGAATITIVVTNSNSSSNTRVDDFNLVVETAGGTITNTHTLTFGPSSTLAGTVTVGSLTSPATVAEGATFNITATSNLGFEFSGWSVSGTGSSVADATSATTTFTMGTADATLTANYNNVPTYTVTYYPNVTGLTPIEMDYNEGEDVTIANNTFTNTGFAFTKWNTAENGSGDDYMPGDVINDIDDDIDLYAQWEASSDVVDVLNWAATGSPTSYTDWTYTAPSGTAYKGQSSGNATGQYIQLRSNNNNSGIVTTSSIGNATKVVVTWNSTTSAGRTLNIYGKNSAYAAATDLYGTNAGDLLGTIVCGTSTELNITGSYAFIGMRSASSAMYLDEIKITWSAGSSTPVPSFTIENNDEIAYDATDGSFTFTVNNPASDGATTVAEDVDWISNAAISGSNVTFNTTANESGAARQGVITLTYTYNTTETVTQDVTITQAGNPSATMTIAEVRALTQGTTVATKGIVTSISVSGSNKTAYMQDATAGIVAYGPFTTTVAVGDEIRVEGELTSYQGLLEIGKSTAAPTVTVLSSGNTVTPAVKTIDQITNDIQAQLIKVEDATVNDISGANTTIAQGTNTIVVRNITETIAVNDIITLTANVGCYSNNPQLVNPTNVTVQPKPSITVTPTTVNVPVEGGSGALTVTYDNITTIVSEVLFYEADGTTAATYTWIAADIDTDNNVEYIIDNNTGDARTAYLKVHALDDDANDVYSDLVTITQAANAPAITTGTIVFGNNGTKINTASVTGDDSMGHTWTITTEGTTSFTQNAEYSQVGSNSSPASKITFTTTFSEETTFTSFSAKFVGSSNSSHASIQLKIGDNAVAYGSYTGPNEAIVSSPTIAAGTSLTVTLLDITGGVKCYYINYTIDNTTDPIIEAPSDVNLSSLATSGEIGYSIFRPVSGNELTAASTTEWISGINVTANKVSFNVTQNTSTTEDRTGTITLSYPGATEKVVTVNQSKVDYATLPFTFTGGKNDIENTIGLTQSGLGSDYGTSTNPVSANLKFDSDGDWLVLHLNEAPTSLSYDIQGNSFTDGIFTVVASADGINYSYDLMFFSSANLGNSLQTITHVDMASDIRYIKWVFNDKGTGNIGVGNIHATSNYDIYGKCTVASLAIGSKTCTVYKGGLLDVTTLSGASVSNLIIEDGGQVKSNNAFNATMKKDITGYGAGNEANKANYYLMGAPVEIPVGAMLVPGGESNFDKSDVYWFDGNYEAAEWRWAEIGGPTLVGINHHGFLFAYRDNCELSIWSGTGQFPATNATIDATSLTNTDAKAFGKYNLVGNPYTCNAYLADGRPFYRMNTTGDAIVLASNSNGGNAIKPLEGVFILFGDTETATSVTFQTTDPTVTSTGHNNNMIDISVSQTTRGEAVAIDAARICFGEGQTLPKFNFMGNNNGLCIPQNGKDYAVVRSEAQGEMPVNFKAANDGTYTLDFSMDNVEFDYLSLIDNKTGMNIDLLQTPNYTFEATTHDYAARFRLVFSANSVNENSSDSFAFISNGQLILTNVDNNATVQVIDALGRMIVNTEASNRVYTDNMAPGVYVLRLVNGNDVKTQKIVVK